MPLAKVRRVYVDTDAGQIHLRRAEPARDFGRPPLVCLHMSPASGFVYETLLAHTGATRLAIAPDTPGFGNSDPLPPYPEIADYAAALRDAIRALGLRAPIDLLGYHTGSKIAAEIAVQAPGLVRRIVMIAASVYTDAELVEFRARYQPGPLFTPDGKRLLETWLWFQRFFRVGERNTIEHAARIFYERLSGRDRHWWGHRAAFRYDFAPALAALDLPILVLNPDDDLATMTPRAAPLLRNGRVLDVPHWTHGFLDTDTAAVTTLLLEFLDAAP